jgi:hypothetical protein
LIAFLASRTIGLPQIEDDIGNWSEPLGLPAIAAEATMVVLAYLRLWGRKPSTTAEQLEA